MKAKGFYIALALCITGAGTAAWLTAQNTINGSGDSRPDPPVTPGRGGGSGGGS